MHLFTSPEARSVECRSDADMSSFEGILIQAKHFFNSDNIYSISTITLIIMYSVYSYKKKKLLPPLHLFTKINTFSHLSVEISLKTRGKTKRGSVCSIVVKPPFFLSYLNQKDSSGPRVGRTANLFAISESGLPFAPPLIYIRPSFPSPNT